MIEEGGGRQRGRETWGRGGWVAGREGGRDEEGGESESEEGEEAHFLVMCLTHLTVEHAPLSRLPRRRVLVDG